jgi:hypothetical protein
VLGKIAFLMETPAGSLSGLGIFHDEVNPVARSNSATKLRAALFARSAR